MPNVSLILPAAPKLVGNSEQDSKSLDLWVRKLYRSLDDMKVATATVEAFPVGSIFTSVVSTDPATLLGYGTWSQVAIGQMLVGFKTGDADFGVVEGVGGAKTTSHDHNHDGTAISNHPTLTHSGGSCTVAAHGSKWVTEGVDEDVSDDNNNHVVTHSDPSSHSAMTHTVSSQPTAHSSHNILNPYYTVYVWKRTA